MSRLNSVVNVSTLITLLVVIFGQSANASFAIPHAEVALLSPRGFKVSIPAQPGMTLFAFHGKLNEEFDSREAGTWSRDILKVRDGRFTFYDRRTELKVGDVIHFWTTVDYNGVGYHQDDGMFTVSGIENNHSEEPITTTTTTTRPAANDNCPKSQTILWETRGPAPAPCAGSLIFEDHFSDGFDANTWRIEQRFSTGPDYEFGFYMNRPDTVSVRNGQLSLGVVRLGNDFDISTIQFGAQCTGLRSTDECEVPAYPATLFTPPIASGQISTINTFRFQYGRIEIRAQLPSVPWLLPQLFLQPADATAYGTEDYASGQMRVAHATLGEPLSGGVLLDAQSPVRELGMCESRLSGRDWQDGWHVYALEWRPNGIAVSLDGVEYCRLGPDFAARRAGDRGPAAAAEWRRSGGAMAPFDRLFYVTLGVGVAGFNDFADGARRDGRQKPWHNGDLHAKQRFWSAMRVQSEAEWPTANGQLLVDYVKVYAL